MLQCLSTALQVLQQTNENCRLMSSIAGFSAEWEAHYNDHFAENHARLQAECQHLLAQQHAIIKSSTSPVNAVHPVDQLDAKHHSTEALPMQKGRKVYTKDDEDTVHDRRELQVEADATSDVTEACEDPWPDADIPGLASPSTTSGTSSSSTNGCNDVINTGSLNIELPHVSSQLHKPVSSHHLRNFSCSPASVPKHANLFCNDQLIYAVFPCVFQVLVAIGTSSAPRTTPSHRPRLRPRTRWKLDNASSVAPIIITDWPSTTRSPRNGHQVHQAAGGGHSLAVSEGPRHEDPYRLYVLTGHGLTGRLNRRPRNLSEPSTTYKEDVDSGTAATMYLNETFTTLKLTDKIMWQKHLSNWPKRAHFAFMGNSDGGGDLAGVVG
ncbi:conserved hypothetical protein [Culex quinquefasciatus]|uniref:Uncharacterized protein n=1 Tax=Culex quinquefasciatus TaxID=7176 RepID=B0X5T2_CULQU|nr:conserved hypothetical protein [Culex quinquefasciatus]|eukprot:XP_001865004.1 conserved hypothetical protein [Culex quinquefasciatus]